jgi:hypothetical protein
LLFTLSLEGSEEYFISYRYHVKNAKLFNESFFVSKAMKPCSQIPYKAPTLTLESDNTVKNSFASFLKKNKEKLLSYLQKLSVSVTNNEHINNNHIESLTTVTFKTQCFKVDFNENFVMITPLK